MADRGYVAARAALALCALSTSCGGCEGETGVSDDLEIDAVDDGGHGTTRLDLAFYAVDDGGQRLGVCVHGLALSGAARL